MHFYCIINIGHMKYWLLNYTKDYMVDPPIGQIEMFS